MPETLPTYHFTSPTGKECIPFDPNGAIFWKGRYHLGYILGNYPEGEDWSWGHASSTDLVEWKLHPPMLSPLPNQPDKGIFSGNAFVDKDGRIAIHYHGAEAGNCIAVNEGDDELDSFVKLPSNPVIKDGWDPFGWLEDDVYYSISGSKPPTSGFEAALYKSTDADQAEWTRVGNFLSHEMPDVEDDEDISCPDFFELGDKRVLLCISHKRGARYYFGRFEDEQFHPEEHFRMNWPGGHCFAPETLLDDRGRRIFWAWAIGDPTSMTLPRVLSLDEEGRMRIEPVEETDSLRRDHLRIEAKTVDADAEIELDGIRGDCLELQVTIDPREAARCGVKVRCSPNGSEQTAIIYDARQKALRIDLAKSSLDSDTLPTYFCFSDDENPVVTAQEGPLDLLPDEVVDLRIYLDRSILEVYANGRQCLTQRIYPTRDDSLGVRLFSEGGPTPFGTIDAWDMAPITVVPGVSS